MKTSNNSSRVKYAVIQVGRSDGRVEHLVIGYPDERTLRQILAKRSIVATGFLTRDEATKESLTCGLPVSLGGYQLRWLKMRTLSRLQSLVGAPKVAKSVVHVARGALASIQSRFRHGRRRLVPVVP